MALQGAARRSPRCDGTLLLRAALRADAKRLARTGAAQRSSASAFATPPVRAGEQVVRLARNLLDRHDAYGRGMELAAPLFLIASLAAPQQAPEGAVDEATASATRRRVELELPPLVITGRADVLLGRAATASEGVAGAEQLATRPLSRAGELLETVPGLLTTQHSGAGKANQFFLRGFNLDHGTDLSTSVGGLPINLPTHGHGQGYTDLSFLIPELVEEVRFRKGPYFADAGDFSSAGNVALDYVDALPQGIASIEVGSFGWLRGLAADSFTVGDGTLLAAVESLHHDGPWRVPENYDRQNALLRWTRGDERSNQSLTLLAYRGEWVATDQVARRAVSSGQLSRFGSLDDSDGGESRRAALVWRAEEQGAESASEVTAYLSYYDLDLFSNFTYFLADPVNGDQFKQSDRRVYGGLDARRRWFGRTFGEEREVAIGAQLRSDLIDNGLFLSRERTVLSTVRRDDVWQSNAGVWAEWKQGLAEWMRLTAGLRADGYLFDVRSDLAANSGSRGDGIVSPRLSLAFGPFAGAELYLSGGLGFHSNDGRGALTDDDPGTSAPGDGRRVDPLVQTRGAEVGLRSAAFEGLQSTLSLWLLDSDSELLFIGDAGNTEASRPSRRFGVEWANWWRVAEGLVLDLDASLSRAAFTDDDPVGDRIPGALTSVVAAGVTWQDAAADRFITLRWRFFGPRPLIEDDSARSASSSLFHLESGWRIDERWGVQLGVFNLFNTKVDDITYFYESQLPGEPTPVAGEHFHPAEPISLRLGISARF